MPFPSFYDAGKVGKLYVPNSAEAIAAAKKVNLKPSSEDNEKVALLLIDAQVDFIHEDGALSVAGAVADTKRTIEWIFENLGQISTIFASLDSHVPLQIFSPSWWIDKDGNHPNPFTLIPHEDVKAGKWKALYQEAWSLEYTERLEEQSKKQLMIWSYHTLIGTAGHNITPALYEAIAYHSAARQSQPRMIIKGMIAESENYSIFEPEVKLDKLPNGGVNTSLLDEIGSYDRIFVAGQAKSHCVLESVSSMMTYFDGKPDMISKIHLLDDAMSSVYSPVVDFEAIANETFAKFEQAGLKRSNTKAKL